MNHHDLASHLFNPAQRMLHHGRLLEPWWRRRFGYFGPGAVLVKPRWLMKPGHMSVGAGCLIYPDAWLAVEGSASHRPGPALVIGGNTVIRDGCTLSAGEEVMIEDNVTLAGGVLVIDSEHGWGDGHPLITANSLRTSPVRICRGTWIGENAVILRGTQIGRFSIVGANSVVRGSFPPFSIVAGSPAEVVGSTRDRVPDSLVDG